MMMRAAVILFALGIVGQVSAQERDFLARFDGGIGVIPATNPDGQPNTVRGVPSPPGPWRIASLRADIDTYGRVKIRGRGLLIANGNAIGTNFNQRVFATLICEVTAPIQRSTDKAGSCARTERRFSNRRHAGPGARGMPNPVLLIRNTGGVWFAAGIPKLSDED